MKHTFFILMILFFSKSNAQTVTIGTQVWMTKNLDVATFRNGDPIPEAKTSEEWKKAGENKQPAWCFYDNDPKNGVKYGKLYNWYAVNDPRGLAPLGYHLPKYDEMSELIEFLGESEISAKKMKSITGWQSWQSDEYQERCQNCSNWNAEYRKKVPCNKCRDTRFITVPSKVISGNGTNKSGFSALPSGFRGYNYTFNNIGNSTSWWLNSEQSSEDAWSLGIDNRNNIVNWNYYNKYYGLSVRCIKD